MIVTHLCGNPKRSGSIITTDIRMSTLRQQHRQYRAVSILRGNKQWSGFVLITIFVWASEMFDYFLEIFWLNDIFFFIMLLPFVVVKISFIDLKQTDIKKFRRLILKLIIPEMFNYFFPMPISNTLYEERSWILTQIPIVGVNVDKYSIKMNKLKTKQRQRNWRKTIFKSIRTRKSLLWHFAAKTRSQLNILLSILNFPAT